MKRWGLLIVAFFLTLFPNIVLAQDQKATMSLTVTNTVKGNQDSTTPFTFQIESKDNAPLPESSRITINGSGNSSFGKITYDNVGTYYYTVQRINNGLQDYSDDTSIYTVQVVVTYRLDNPDQLIATAVAYKSGENGKEDLTFQSVYTGKTTETSSSASSNIKKDSSQKGLKRFLPNTGQSKNLLTIIGFVLVGCVAIMTVVYRRRKK